MTKVYKILRRDEWRRAQAAGAFAGSAVDHRDGYIHMSTAAQAQETARLHFKGQGDLVVLEIEAESLGAGLRWEASRGGQLFPHLYGNLPAAHVTAVLEAPLDGDGVPVLGSLNN
jgi:uncharacterized protein (DUF952 family)